LADRAAANQFDRAAELAIVFGTLLGARLEDAAMATKRVDHGAAPRNKVGGWLFAVDVLACPRGQHGQEPLGARGHRDEHRVQVIALDHLAKIGVGLHPPVVSLAHALLIVGLAPGLARFGPLLPHVANGHHLHVLAGQVPARQIGPTSAEQVPAALAALTGEAHRDPVARRHEAACSGRATGGV